MPDNDYTSCVPDIDSSVEIEYNYECRELIARNMIATHFHGEIQAYCHWLRGGMPEYTIVCEEQDELNSKVELQRHNSGKRHCIVISKDYAEKWITSEVPAELRWSVQNSLMHFVVYLRSGNAQ
jgi:hypothetical protein